MKMSSRTPSVKQRQRAEVVHMLDKLNQYRQNFALPFYKKNHKATSYSFEWVEDLAGLQQVQQFRAVQFGAQFNLHFANGLDQDLYDFNCEHAVLRDKVTQEIVAYTRIKRLQGYELVTKSYSQHEFDYSQPIGPFRAYCGNWTNLCASTLSFRQSIVCVVAKLTPQGVVGNESQICHWLCECAAQGQ